MTKRYELIHKRKRLGAGSVKEAPEKPKKKHKHRKTAKVPEILEEEEETEEMAEAEPTRETLGEEEDLD